MRGQMKNFYYRRFQIGFVRYNNTLYVHTKYHMLTYCFYFHLSYGISISKTTRAKISSKFRVQFAVH